MTEQQDAETMTAFRDYVKELPPAWIFDNLLGGSAGSRGILSSAMITEAAAKFSAPAALVKRFKALSPAMRVRCSQVYLTGGNGLTLCGAGGYAKEPLLSSLLVFAARPSRGGSTVKLFGFREFEETLRPLMAQTLADAGAAGDGAPHAAGCPWRPLNDVAAVAAHAAHGILKRNAHGGLVRAAVATLKKLTHDPTLAGKSLAADGSHPAGFLIGYCLKEGIIFDSYQEYALNVQAFHAWNGLSMKERMAGLSEYADEFTDGFNLKLLRGILACGTGRRMAENCLVPEPDRQALKLALYVLEFFDCLRTSYSQNGTMRFCAVEKTDEDMDLLLAKQAKVNTVIMPDFTALFPQEVAPDELFEFSKTGTLAAFDKVYKGKITKASICNSLSAGTEPAHIREWLAERRAAANITKTIDEWIREFERLFVCDDATLITADEKVTGMINAFEPLRKHLECVPAHAVYRIRPGSEQKVLDTLEKLGFDTRAHGENVYAELRRNALGRLADDDAADPESEETAQESPQDMVRWTPVTDFSSPAAEEPRSEMRGTKYGSRLKTLGISEMIQVIDYAMLTNQAIIVDYAGSANIKQNIYTAVPVGMDKGINAAVEAVIQGVRGRKRLDMNRIKRIGVVAQ